MNATKTDDGDDRIVRTKNAAYKLTSTVLGVGGTSVVRLGERESDGKKFALKFFKKASFQDLEEAKGEYERSKKLGFHPNLVNTVDFDTDITYPIHPEDGGGTQKVAAVLVMDYCPHGTLIDLLLAAGENKTLTVDMAAHVCKQLFTALDHIHKKGVAHCDLKWEQTLLDDEFNVKLTDWGSSCENFKRRDSWMGTQSYWSPEQHESGSWDKVIPDKADIFAAAVMMHIAFTSKPPWGEANKSDWFFNKFSSDATRPDYYMWMGKYGIKMPDVARKAFEALASLDQNDRPSASETLSDGIFVNHRMGDNEYSAAMRTFYEDAYQNKSPIMKGFSDFQDEMAELSLADRRLFRGDGKEEEGLRPETVDESRLTSSASRSVFRLPSEVSVSKASVVIVKVVDTLKECGASVDFKKKSPFVCDAAWTQTLTKCDGDARVQAGGQWTDPSERKESSNRSMMRLERQCPDDEEPLHVVARINVTETGRDERLALTFDLLSGPRDRFKEVCERINVEISSPNLALASDSETRSIRTKNATYELLPKVLGVGGTSVVRLGVRQSDKKKFALKFFKTLSERDLECAREEYAMSRMLGEHPHLVNTVDFEEDVEYPVHESEGGGVMKVPAVLVTDYCPNGSVIDFLMALGEKGEKLSVESATVVTAQLLAALKHIHSKKIAHCDLKFEQCLFDENFNVKLLDFGSAAEGLKRRDAWLGTPSYWSPEQHDLGSGNWSSVDPEKADMFAMGALLHIAFTSIPPFGEANSNDWYWRALSDLSGPSRYYKYMESNNIRLPEGAKVLFESMTKDEQTQRPSAATILESKFFATAKAHAKKYEQMMQRLKRIAYPEIKANDASSLDAFAEDMAQCSVHDRHLFRGAKVGTKALPKLSVHGYESGPDSTRIHFESKRTNDDMVDTATKTFALLTKRVEATGGHSSISNHQAYVLIASWAHDRLRDDAGITVEASTKCSRDMPQALPRLEARVSHLGKTVRLSREDLSIECKIGICEKGRDSKLAVEFNRRSGRLSDFRKMIEDFQAAICSKKKPTIRGGDSMTPPPSLLVSASTPSMRGRHVVYDACDTSSSSKVDIIGRHVHLAFIGACPLVDETGKTLAHLDVPREMEMVNDVIQSSGRQVKWAAYTGCDTLDKLRKAVKEKGGCQILHVSAHGDADGRLLLEAPTPPGTVHRFPGEDLDQLIRDQGKHRPRLLVLMNCFSESVAQKLRRNGEWSVNHVICVDERYPILDAAVTIFSKEFYRCIFCGKSVISSFLEAVRAVRTSTSDEVMKEAASRFKLLDESAERHKQFIFAPIVEGVPSRYGDSKVKSQGHPAAIPNFVGRDGDIVKLLKLFTTNTRAFTLLHGPRGVGKTALAKTLGRYMFNHDLCSDLYVIGPDDSERLAMSDFGHSDAMLRKVGDGLRISNPPLSDPKQVLKWASKNKRAFVIFDNCEPFMTSKKFIQVLKNIVGRDNDIKVLFISRKAHRNFFEVIGLGSRMPMYSLTGLSRQSAALLFCKSCPRNLTYPEMGPKTSRTKSIDENMRLFAMSPIMSLFPNLLPERVCRGASLVGPYGSIPADDQTSCEQHFKKADADGNGEIDSNEIKAYMLEYGYQDAIIKSVFGEGAVKLNRDAFLRIWRDWGPSVILAKDLADKLKRDEVDNTVPNTYPLHTLTTRDVLMLMRVNGLGMFCRDFRDQGVDGSLLSMVESPDDLKEVGVHTALHRRKLFRMISGWKESMQMVTREELEEAEKMQLCHVGNDLKSGKSSDPRILLAEHLRVQLATASYMLLRRVRSISKGYLCKSNACFRKSHWECKTVYGKSCDEMASLDSEYAIKTTLYAFGRYLAFHLLAMKNMSIFMDDACLVNIYPTMLRSIEFAMSGEGIDLQRLGGCAQHPTWGLGKVPSGLFQLMSYDQTEIGEAMLVKEDDNVLGCRCLSFIEFKQKCDRDRIFRKIFSRLNLTCQMLHAKENLKLYCEGAKSGVMLRAEHRGRLVWLHNQLCSLTLQLDHNLALRQQSVVYDDQETLWHTLEELKMEQEIQDLMNGYQRKLMCDSIFIKWMNESPNVDVEKDLTADSKRLVNAQTVGTIVDHKRDRVRSGSLAERATSFDTKNSPRLAEATKKHFGNADHRMSFSGAHEKFRPPSPSGIPNIRKFASTQPRVKHILKRAHSSRYLGQ